LGGANPDFILLRDLESWFAAFVRAEGMKSGRGNHEVWVTAAAWRAVADLPRVRRARATFAELQDNCHVHNSHVL
jgi:hypothetical protein